MTSQAAPAAGAFQLLTSPGPAGIAIVRIRGPAVQVFAERHLRTRQSPGATARHAGGVFRAALLDESGNAIDDILLSVHAGSPIWDLRLHLHGNPWLVRRCTELLCACGLTAEAEGQATLWPTGDAIEAEGYALLPHMLTLRGARWLLGQVGQLRGAIHALLASPSIAEAAGAAAEMARRAHVVDWFRRPLRVALVGPPSAGKSTLANALAGRAVSVVSPTPGTTRDWVEVWGEADGFPVLWRDTAGICQSGDWLELAAAERTRRAIVDADAIVVVLDVTMPAAGLAPEFVQALGGRVPDCVALNKSDVSPPCEKLREALPPDWQPRVAVISARQSSGLAQLCCTLLASAGRNDRLLELPAPFTARQARLLGEAAVAADLGTLRCKLEQLIDAAEAANCGGQLGCLPAGSREC